jgi:predicted DNA-binding protein (UPF0251 family)
MPRPFKKRRINFNPNVTYFKPQGLRLSETETIVLYHDELEAIRLKDYEGLDQNACAEKMRVSQPTFHRILLKARKKVATAIIKGCALEIEKIEEKKIDENE